MGFEIILNTDSLLNAMQTKADEVPDKLEMLGNESALILQRNARDEAPFITNNLIRSITPVSDGPLGWIIAPDEGIAPYALFVILEGVTRRYAGNDFLQRGEENAQGEIDEEVAKFEEWCGNLDA